jgi:V/A-type H+/Na+-transporting ATPase subunit D
VERLPLSANKSNLLRLEEELAFARDGRELLDEKKQALMTHIDSLSAKAERVRSHMSQDLEAAYGHLQEAVVTHGRPACERAALAARAGEEVAVREKSFMGVALPLVRINLPKLLPAYGFLGTGASMDAVAKSIGHSLEAVAELAEIEVGLFRLVAEIKRTIKRINALENIYIPLYEATIKHIEASLQEKEREFLFQLKRQKAKRGVTSQSVEAKSTGFPPARE